MKERDPFTGSLFSEPSPFGDFAKTVAVAVAESEVATDLLDEARSDEILRAVACEKRTDPRTLFCMHHMKWEEGVAIYIHGKRALFLCAAEAQERGAWKWEGKWPERK